MSDRGAPLCSHKSWEELILTHSEPLFSNQIWNRLWTLYGQPFIPLIKSIELPLAKDSVEIVDEE